MTTTEVTVRFAIRLAEQVPTWHEPYGPLFHRWAPNGRDDSVLLCDSDAQRLEVWFERRGEVDSFYYYDPAKSGVEISDEVLDRQGSVDGGLLFGELELARLNEATLTALNERERDADVYVKLTKRVVRTLVAEVGPFVEKLRHEYGQFWLRALEPVDSRFESLRSRALHWNLSYHTDDLSEWVNLKPQVPEPGVVIQIGAGAGFLEFVTQDDWEQIRATPKCETSDTPEIIVEARQALEREDLKLAFILAGTALELAVDGRIRAGLVGLAAEKAQQIYAMGASAKVATVGGLGDLKNGLLVATLQGLETRNAVAHDGFDPQREIRRRAQRNILGQRSEFHEQLSAMVHVCYWLLGMTTKEPFPAVGVMSSDSWDDRY